MLAIGVIPARLASTRLPNKPLADLCGIPVVIRVWQNAKKSRFLDDVYIATDSKEIASVCKKYGANYIMTDADLPSGTDRVHSAMQKIGLFPEIILNIQGDEPFLLGEDIDLLVSKFAWSKADCGTFIQRIRTYEELKNPNCVKVAITAENEALYFSRAAIPFCRDCEKESLVETHTFWKHVGVYAYKPYTLEKFIELEQSLLEKTEKLEQLRLLEDGAKFLCVEIKRELIGIDTPEDLENARNLMERMI